MLVVRRTFVELAEPAAFYEEGSVLTRPRACTDFEVDYTWLNSLVELKKQAYTDESESTAADSHEDARSESSTLWSDIVTDIDRTSSPVGFPPGAWNASPGAWSQPSQFWMACPQTDGSWNLPAASQLSKHVEDLPAARATTLQLKNLPKDLTRAQVLAALDAEGFAEAFDFVYLPRDLKSGKGFSYAFVNFTTEEKAVKALRCFDGFHWFSGGRSGTARLSDRDQGLAAQIARCQDKPVMHSEVPDDYKPALFARGKRIVFTERPAR